MLSLTMAWAFIWAFAFWKNSDVARENAVRPLDNGKLQGTIFSGN